MNIVKIVDRWIKKNSLKIAKGSLIATILIVVYVLLKIF